MNKISVDRELFLSKLQKANKFIGGKGIVPAFDNFLLIVDGDSMNIIASDGSIQLRLKCRVQSSADFSVCVNAKWLLGNVSLYHDSEITIIRKDVAKEDNIVQTVEIKCGKSKGKITCDCKPEEFPIMQLENSQNDMSITHQLLKVALKTAEKFVDENDPNGSRVAINIANIDNKIVFTGLTNFNMCRAAVRPLSITKWSPVPIPPDTAIKVISVLEERGEIAIAHNGGKICFFTNGESLDSFFEVTSVTSTAKFPDTEVIFARKSDTKVTINTSEFRDATKRLLLYAEPQMPAMMKMSILDQFTMHLFSQDSLSGKDGEEVITIENPNNHPLEKSFTNKYFLEIISCVDTNEFDFHFDSDVRIPSFVVPKVNSEEEEIFTFLIANTGSAVKKK